MKGIDLYRSFGEVDEDLLERSQKVGSKKRTIAWAGAVAAVLTVVLAGLSFSGLFNTGVGDETPEMPFVITVKAKNGETTQLGLNDTCYNSVGTEQNNSDKPLFNFIFTPEVWQTTEEIYTSFTAEIFMNGSKLDPKDDRIMMAWIISSETGKPMGYDITGWVEDPTDLMICINDQKTGQSLEAVTLHVAYDPSAKAYKLTVIQIEEQEELL